MELAFSKTLKCTLEEAIVKVTEVLKSNGFGVLTEIDSQATIKKKLGIDIKPYRILGACNPKFAHKALEIDPAIGILLPCNVLVYENDEGNIVVSFTNVETKFAGYPKDTPKAAQMSEIAVQISQLIKNAYDALE